MFKGIIPSLLASLTILPISQTIAHQEHQTRDPLVAAVNLGSDMRPATGNALSFDKVKHQAHHQRTERHIAKDEPFYTVSKNAQSVDNENQCQDPRFAQQGTGQLIAIKQQGYACVERLFSRASYQIRRAAFSQNNMLTVAREAKRVSAEYKGKDDKSYLTSLYYWLKAFYYFDNRALLTAQNQSALREALDTLFANSHVLDNTPENARVIDHAADTLNNGLVAEHYVPFLHKLLSVYNHDYEQTKNWGRAFATISWDVLYYCANRNSCRQTQYNEQLVNGISTFIDNNLSWMANKESDYHLHNLGYQLANMYTARHDSEFAKLEPKLSAVLKDIFKHHTPFENHGARRLYISALSGITEHEQCQTFDLCNEKDEIIRQILNDRIACPSGRLELWAQDMNQAQKEWACRSLVEYENKFHDILNTQRIPVSPDDNDKLRMVVFDNSREWRIYGYALFGASTDNGGLYLEGDPAKPGDQATFFAYENANERPVFDIWNLRHEYIHYLDGRYIKQGDFHKVHDTGRTTWYSEGLAEYLSKYDCHSAAISAAKTGQYSLSTILDNEYGVGSERIYSWGYLAVRYMLEQQRPAFDKMLGLFRSGHYNEYRHQLVDKWVAERTYDLEFSHWLNDVTIKGCSIDNTRPVSPPVLSGPEAIQGSDPFGFDACAAQQYYTGQPLELGKGYCFKSIDASSQKEFEMLLPSGLENNPLRVELRHGSGNADLYYKFDNRPYPSTYHLKSTSPNNDETLHIQPLVKGWHYFNLSASAQVLETSFLARVLPIDKSIPQPLLAKAGSTSLPALKAGETVLYQVDVKKGEHSVSLVLNNASSIELKASQFIYPALASELLCQRKDSKEVKQCLIRNTEQGALFVELTANSDVQGASLNLELDSSVPSLADSCATRSGNDYVQLHSGHSVCIKAQDNPLHSRDFYVFVSEDTKRLTVSTGFGNGSANLYEKYGNYASSGDYDNKSVNSGTKQEIVIESPQYGWHYLHIRGQHTGVSIQANLE